jgi:hypothetical protein
VLYLLQSHDVPHPGLEAGALRPIFADDERPGNDVRFSLEGCNREERNEKGKREEAFFHSGVYLNLGGHC